MRSRTVLSRRWLRALASVVAISACAINAALLFADRWILAELGIAPPADRHLFLVETSLSLTLALALLFAARQRVPAVPLLAVGVLGKWAYAVTTFAFGALGRVHPYFYAAVLWDAVTVVVFLLYWIDATGDDLLALQLDVNEGIASTRRASSRRALLVRLAGKERPSALARVGAGLAARGYEVDEAEIVPEEKIFDSRALADVLRVAARAFVRAPAKIAPLAVPSGREWDLVVVESEDVLFGAPAPIEAMFVHPANRWLFQGRDAVALVVSNGAHRRTLAAVVRYLERAGANVVAARALAGGGSAAGPEWNAEAESLGKSLADRARGRPHWTLLLGEDGERGDA